ncbi:unnamed protein product [Colias eurytheme]|nr:unnamed protein product [Colias eurytheme]
MGPSKVTGDVLRGKKGTDEIPMDSIAGRMRLRGRCRPRGRVGGGSGAQQSAFREPSQYRFAATCDTFAARYLQRLLSTQRCNGTLNDFYTYCKFGVPNLPYQLLSC